MTCWKLIAVGALVAVGLNAQPRLGAPPPAADWEKISQRPLGDFRSKKLVVVLAEIPPPGIPQLAGELARRNVELLYAKPPAAGSFVWLLDEQGILRRREPLPSSLASIPALIDQWELGKKAFAWGCPECHGSDGHEGYNGARSLAGIGNRLSREQIRTTLNATKVSVDRYSIRCCQFTRRELEALIVFVAGL